MTDAASLDRRAAGNFARSLVERLSAFMTVTMLQLGLRLGLLAALSEPRTVAELAEATGTQHRYVEEWLGLMAAAGIVRHQDGVFTLPPEHAVSFLGDSPYNLSAMLSIATAAAHSLDELERVFVEGGGISYAEQPLDTDATIDALTSNRYDALLVGSYLAQVPGLAETMSEGARILEVGCGRGHAARLIARAFPAAHVVGLDISEAAVAAATGAAVEEGLANVEFHVGSATEPPAGPWDVILAFDVVHDLAEPYAALAAVRSALAEDGRFLMIDSGAPPTLAEQADLPWAPMMYGVSISHCLTISLAQDGEGLGTMWGREAAVAALADAGFDDVTTYELKGDPMDLLYVARF